MSGELAVAVIAEHVCTGSSLEDIVARLGASDRCNLATEAITIEAAASRLRDIAAPRRTDSPNDSDSHRSPAPQHTSIRNKFPATCVCRRHVPEGRGRAVRIDSQTSWVVYCSPCARERGYL